MLLLCSLIFIKLEFDTTFKPTLNFANFKIGFGFWVVGNIICTITETSSIFKIKVVHKIVNEAQIGKDVENTKDYFHLKYKK